MANTSPAAAAVGRQTGAASGTGSLRWRDHACNQVAPSLHFHCNFEMNINENLELNTIAALAGKRDLSRVRQGDIIFRKGELGGKLYSVVS